MQVKCKYCKKYLSNKYSLKTHQNTAKYCLKIREKNGFEIFICSECIFKTTSRQALQKHQQKCIKFLLSQHKKDISEKKKYEQIIYEKNKEIKEIKENMNKIRKKRDNSSKILDMQQIIDEFSEIIEKEKN